MLKKHGCSGQILIDVMLTVGLGMLLLSILLDLYLASQRSLQLQNALIRMEDNARAALDILTSEIHQAGYIGCPRLTDDFPVISHVEHSISQKNKLTGSNADEIIIRHVEFPASVITAVSQDRNVISVSNVIRFSAGDLLFISDCRHAEIVRAESVNAGRFSQTVKLSHLLRYRFESDAEVSKFAANKFYLAKSRRFSANGSPVFSLMMQDMNGRNTEMVAGIRKMQFLYSVYVGHTLKDMPANEIIDWAKVTGVVINLDAEFVLADKTWHAFVTVGSL